MPAVTVADLNNAKLDVDTIAAIATSTALTVTDRLGHTKLSVLGAVTTLKAFNLRGARQTGVTYSMKDVYTEQSIAYVAVVASFVSASVVQDISMGYVTVHQGATKEELANQDGAGRIGYSRLSTYVNQSLGLWAQEFLTLQEFFNSAQLADYRSGVTPTIDGTAGMQAALNFSRDSNRVLYCGNLAVKITGPLTMAGPGIIWDRVGYLPGLHPTGSGYTVLTVTGRPNKFDANLFGNDATLDAILFDGIAEASIGHIRVTNFIGSGVEFRMCYDFIYQSVSLENCGSTSKYAFSITDGAGTSNEFNGLRTQVERCRYGRAMYVSPNSVSGKLSSIHSEQATGVVGVITWQLGGNGTLTDSVRLDASGGVSANATAVLSGAGAQFNSIRAEGDINVKLEGYTGNPLILINPLFTGTTSLAAGQTGTVSIEGGTIFNLQTQALGLRVYGTRVINLNLGTAALDPTRAIFDGCYIGNMVNGAADAAATFHNCQIPNFLPSGGRFVLNNCQVGMGSAYTFSGGALVCNNTEVTCGTLTIDSALLHLKNSSVVRGNLTMAGNFNSISDDSSFATGAVAGWTSPVFATYLVGGVFTRGMRSKNLAPAVGSPKAWVYTGTYPFTSEGNL